VLNFGTQNPPELALPASKKRNPTLQRIKRIMGQPAQTYPQNPIISIPMLLTLLFSAGLIASAQQDSPDTFEAIEPNVIMDNPEIFGLESDYRFPSSLDTLKKETVIQKTVTKTESPMVWTTDSGEKIIVRSNGTNSFTYRITGDTLIVDGDTIIGKGDQSFVFRGADGMDWASMPKMDLDFPEAPEAPAFPEVLISFFEMGEMPVMPAMAEMPPMPDMEGLEFVNSFPNQSNHPIWSDGVIIIEDTTNMTKAEKEKWAKEIGEQANEWAKRSKEAMKDWEPTIKAWEKKMTVWQKENEPRMKEFEEKMKAWQTANEPKMKEFEEKMKAWEKAQEPKMKEFEKEMEEWQKEFQPKMEEFQRKMEIWQEENSEKFEEFQRKLEEQFKKKDNSKN
jgi:hypothetical protein